nr:retrotransposon protein, putative, Ty3-gypsy subclass [Tanacetum cinerariifolium]
MNDGKLRGLGLVKTERIRIVAMIRQTRLEVVNRNHNENHFHKTHKNSSRTGVVEVKTKHQSPSGLLQQPEFPEWKWERIAMDFVTMLPRTSSGHDTIRVIIKRLTKSAHFLPIREDYKTDRLDMSTAYHPQIDSQSEHTIQTLKDMLRACIFNFRGSWDVHLPLVEFLYNNSYHSSVRCAPFKALYGRKCHSPIMWVKVREWKLIRPELVQESTEKIS